MRRHQHLRIILILLLSFCIRISWAQFAVENSWKVGEHNASDGTYLKTSISGYYFDEEFTLNSQLQFDVINPQQRVLSGLQVNASRDSIFKKFPITVTAQYQLLPYSETLRESNVSIIASKCHKGFSYALGFNFRTYAYTRQAVEDYDIQKKRYHENFGLMYSLGYTYSPKSQVWDAGLFFTNWDDFLINQDMNPFFRLKGEYHINSQWDLYTEGNYIKAGMFNGSSNHFGYYINTGVIWHIN